MPASPVSVMRARALQPPRRISDEEKERRKAEREKKKTAIPTWLMALMLFIVFGSMITQIYATVTTSRKMAD